MTEPSKAIDRCRTASVAAGRARFLAVNNPVYSDTARPFGCLVPEALEAFVGAYIDLFTLVIPTRRGIDLFELRECEIDFPEELGIVSLLGGHVNDIGTH